MTQLGKPQREGLTQERRSLRILKQTAREKVGIVKNRLSSFSIITGYDPDNFDNLIKRKYWEVFQEKEKDDLERELIETRKKRSRIILSTVCAFKGHGIV